MKKIGIVILFLSALFLSLPSFAEFLDVPKDSEFYPPVQKLLQYKIVNLSSGRKFNGETSIDMYQLAYILDQVLALTGKIKEIEAKPLDSFYVDVPSDHYANKAIRDLVKLGLFSIPKSKKFSGKAEVNRYTFYSYFAAFLEGVEGRKLPASPPGSGYFDVPTDHLYYLYIQKLIGAGLLDGKGKFGGDFLLSRYEMAGFTARVLDFYMPGAETRKEVKKKESSIIYPDVPKEHYARQAIEELTEVEILPPGKDQEFNGGILINRYLLVDLISKIIEKIADQELEPASPAQAYKDVPPSHFAYRSIQKMIALGTIPPGNGKELFYGDRKISRYQMVYFVFSAIEGFLSDVMAFPPAHSTLGYRDVPRDHFVYETIQKLVWLGVLEGGGGRSFRGDEYVDRYELAFFSVNLLKAIYLKLEEIKEATYKKSAGYGFNAYLTTGLNASQIMDGKGPGENLIDLSASQTISISIDRRINRYLSAFAAFNSSYTFGDSTTPVSAYLDQANVRINSAPFMLQIGRTNFYQGFTPFGNSLFIDTYALDMIEGNYDHESFNLYGGVGKFAYLKDINLDSKFGFMSLSPKLPPFLSWIELMVGGSLITDLPEPNYTYTLPGRAIQSYAGAKINLFNEFELTAENSRMEFSDLTVLPIIGYSDKEDLGASQYALTYYAEDYGYSLSVGYQIIGDDYYVGKLASPAAFLETGQNTESYLVKMRFNPSQAETIGIELASVNRDSNNFKSAIGAYYNLQVFESAYLYLALSKYMDQTSATPEKLNVSSSLSISF